LFSEDETSRLISIADKYIKFDKETVKTIFETTGGHPMFTQCICDAAFRFAEKNNTQFVSPAAVKKITDAVIKQNASAVLWIWHTLPDNAKIILYISAHILEKKKKLNVYNIKYQANILNLTPATSNLDETLDLLVRNRFLKHSAENNCYAFYVEFIRKWIISEIYKEGISKLISHLDEELKLYETNANFYFKNNNWEETKIFASKVLERLPENFIALTQLMVANAKTGKPDISYNFYNKAKNINELTTNEIIENYKISYSGFSQISSNNTSPLLVSCNCKICKDSKDPHLYFYNDLLLRKKKGKQTIECYKSFEDVDVESLLSSIDNEE
jgi:hypothetical protein